MENEYTSEKLVLFAIFVPENFHNPSKFDKVLTKKFAQFFSRHAVNTLCLPTYLLTYLLTTDLAEGSNLLYPFPMTQTTHCVISRSNVKVMTDESHYTME